jgi:hypothetical protein
MSGRKNARQPRHMDVRSVSITLVHRPTKIEVGGQVPEGHYSRKEMISQHKALCSQLFAELETRVAKHLKIPGR